MYSVGMVALELFQPFGTEMERVQRLGELRQGKVPETLSERWPVLAKYIRLLTSPDPSLRPSAAQLLQCELFNDSTDQVCSTCFTNTAVFILPYSSNAVFISIKGKPRGLLVSVSSECVLQLPVLK